MVTPKKPSQKRRKLVKIETIANPGQRRDNVLKKLLATPPEPHSDMKLGKSRKAKS